MAKKLTEVKNLKAGKYCIIDGVACKVTSIDISKPGKHGSAKARVSAVGLDGKKRQIVKPADDKIGVPIIDKRKAQVTAVSGDSVHLMDLETYETFELKVPKKFKGKLEQGEETMYWEVLGERILRE